MSLPDPRNTPAAPAVAPADGGKYPNVSNDVTTRRPIPSGCRRRTSRYDVGEHAVARFAAVGDDDPARSGGAAAGRELLVAVGRSSARSATRRSSPICRTISISASNIIPGGRPGQLRRVPQGAEGLHRQRHHARCRSRRWRTYGITYDSLTPTQQAAITSRGGPGAATVQITQQVNASGTLT